ncbi:hypothetical protein HNQ07_003964 [Deinococcus metalli]|uniref:Uncharacterized protein n=1 Tax=Deinococcus metalli TaxID=1141878 RepID=A0A7W8NTQ4_9DEIO|nr:hypothetical protein [Deinococcus metalli]MBB5378457.1 hypothetical protein [Deinococcus metalli]GHF57853.1 hypothetical protein GCM10017781_37570 [Deinococcus metalli]
MTTFLPPTPWSHLRLRQVTFDRPATIAVHDAAARHGVSAALVASVLADERTRLDLADRVQNLVMRGACALPRRARHWLLEQVERACGRPVESFSLGHAQMKVATLTWLGIHGYLTVPASLDAKLDMLLDDARAPTLVAACLRATTDHWRAGGVDIAARADILGTLYSIGLTGAAGVHPEPRPNDRGAAIAAHARWLMTRPAFMGTEAGGHGRGLPVGRS